ncbi:hypothetical protein BDA96_03G129000 [Sorghum bicolor]|uniref:Uncharacterized protein n=2 Tax=Sorghum bicolor TaxID=4558 RepID=A0A921RC52_SORBI|nr:uncharacterized protein LOC8054624 [Sorghum bicolor]EES00537.1 hypothetical protein SORBI_3003G123600 [Sorghum bicolor]KAG0537212.1 hypothetical protein BDA96_03G129000 [Sorghum bicolor]|eukprot:XP_002455417.1 uncharacterized protein LOC8054624 [Sorghum bicolor]
MASIVLLLSELLGGESASVLAAERYMGGHRSLGEFRPAVTEAPARHGQRLVDDQHAAAAGTERARRMPEDKKRKEESFEDLAMPRIAVDIMWP